MCQHYLDCHHVYLVNNLPKPDKIFGKFFISKKVDSVSSDIFLIILNIKFSFLLLYEYIALTNTVKNTHNSEKNVNPISISDKSGLVFVFGRFSDRIRRKTISESITVIANDILSPIPVPKMI